MPSHIRNSLGSEYRQANKSGEGFEIFLPEDPNSAESLPTDTPGVALFQEMGAVVGRLLRSRSLLVGGEPGEGKSHLRDDITIAGAAVHDVPFLVVKCHVNATKATGIGVMRDKLQELRDASDGSKLLVFDNLDFVGYKGAHRTRTRSRDFAKQLEPIIEEVVDDETLLTLGFVHDQEWRNHRWVWNDPADPTDPAKRDPEIYPHAERILGLFSDEYNFEGWLTDFGLQEVIEEAGGDQELLEALQSTASLRQFFYARHLDPALFKKDPERAIRDIKHRRSEMKKI